jgi:hypothetical protein
MESVYSIKTAYHTFFGCVFTSLKELNFKNAVFAAEGMECSDLQISSFTFYGFGFGSDFSTIILPQYNAILGL